MGRKLFFQKCKDIHLFDSFSQLQVDSINAILDKIEKYKVVDVNQQAYIFATAYKEAFDYNGKSTGTIQRIVPIIEGGGIKYLKSKSYYPYYGRGFAQTTWPDAYKKEEKRTGLPFFKNPDLMLVPENSADNMVFNMVTGGYTKRKLSDFFNDKIVDFENARKIINPKDFKSYHEIAGFAKLFKVALSGSIT